MKNKINIGVIGLGVGLNYLKVLHRNKNVGKICVFDFNKKKLELVKIKYKNVKICNSSDEILHNKSINLVCIASYDSYHFEQTIKSIKNNKHIFVEKPLCLKLTELRIIFKLINKNNLFLSTNFNLRSSETFKNLKKKIYKKKDKVYYLEGDYNSGRIKKITNGWRSKEKYHSIILSSAIHIIDIICWILGEYPIEVSGFSNKIVTKNTNFKYDDFAVGIFKFKGNILCKITANIGCVYPHFHKISIYSKDKTYEQNLLGSVLISKSKGDITINKIKNDYRKRNRNKILDNFINNLSNKKIPDLSRDSTNIFKIMNICFAFIDSIKKNRKIKISYLK